MISATRAVRLEGLCGVGPRAAHPFALLEGGSIGPRVDGRQVPHRGGLLPATDHEVGFVLDAA